jgi:hypothetical protein
VAVVLIVGGVIDEALSPFRKPLYAMVRVGLGCPYVFALSEALAIRGDTLIVNVPC